tara:strand:+ start:31793 stop:32563 length:771 start_codon:yes stop_codon:yes gene_type:complete
MKLKIKIYKLIVLLFVFLTISLKAQNKNVKIKGTVKYDSTYLQDINIQNKTTKLGASSNKNGLFKMYVKEGDSLLFSSVVYENRIIIISKKHINSKKITVYLEPDYYQLEEVMLAKKIFINWRDAAVSKGAIFETDKMSNRKPPDARKLTDPNAQAGSINPIAIFMMLTKKSRLKRKARKLELKEMEQLKIEFPTTIKNLYGAIFFEEILHISENNTYLFLDYCEGNGLIELYNMDEIVIKNFLIKQSKKFNSIQN